MRCFCNIEMFHEFLAAIFQKPNLVVCMGDQAIQIRFCTNHPLYTYCAELYE